jgi:hypothetical protein
MNNKIFYGLILGISMNLSCTESKKENSNGLSNDSEGPSEDKPYIEPADRKYDIRSGMITYRIEGTGENTIRKVYFDDYGNKEVAEIYTEGVITEKLINKGDGSFYSLDFGNKTGVKRKASMDGTEQRFDIEEMPEDMKKENKVTPMADEKIVGKTCKSYSMESGGIKTTKSGSGHIILKLITEMGGANKIQTTATEIKENADIPGAVYEIPSDFSIKEF